MPQEPAMSQSLLEEQQYKGDYHRPRRPDSNSISYLRSLPLDLDSATTEIQSFTNKNGDDGDFPATLAASLQALYEIRHELASLAGDEHAAQVIELLIHVALPRSQVAARIVLQAIQTYGLHLATHRYGSHVLQTILEVLPKSAAAAHAAAAEAEAEAVDWALHDQAPELPVNANVNDVNANVDDPQLPRLPSLSQLLASLVEELLPAVRDLAVHICGSHVLRSLLCLLGSVERIHSHSPAAVHSLHHQQQPRRGKMKTKKRKKPGSAQETNTAAASVAQATIVYLKNNNVVDSDTAQRILGQFTEELTGFADPTQGPGTLQRMACHTSAAPVLTILLQVLTYRDFAKSSSPQKMEFLIQQQAHWQTATTTPPDRHLSLGRRPEPVYAVDSDAHGLVQRILCWDKSTRGNGDLPLPTCHMADVIYGLAGEPRGSHVLETILRLSPDSVYQTILDASRLLESSTLRDYVMDDVSNFVVQTLLGTLRTTAQAKAAVTALQPLSNDLLDPRQKRRGILWRLTELAASPIGSGTCQEGVVQIIEKGCEALDPKSNEWSSFVAHLLQIQRDNEDDNNARIKMDVPGTRTLYHLLQLDATLSQRVLDGVLDLPADSLEALARDALGCRCTVDAIVLGQGAPFVEARRRLRQKLQGRWVALANDRVGHHVVTKLFRHLDCPKEKEALVQELANGKSRMNGNNMGRSVLEALEVRAYQAEGAAHWLKLIKKQQDKETWLDEIVQHGDDERPRSDRKREKEIDAEKSLKKKSKHTTTFDAIFEAISIPEGKKATKKSKK